MVNFLCEWNGLNRQQHFQFLCEMRSELSDHDHELRKKTPFSPSTAEKFMMGDIALSTKPWVTTSSSHIPFTTTSIIAHSSVSFLGLLLRIMPDYKVHAITWNSFYLYLLPLIMIHATYQTYFSESVLIDSVRCVAILALYPPKCVI